MNTHKKLVIGGIVAVVLAFFVGSAIQSQTLRGGDFAGGIVPSQLFTANGSTNGVTPVGNLNIGFGGTAAANQIVTVYTAVANYPAATNVTLGGFTAATSTTSTAVSFSASGFSVGDSCEIAYNGATTTSAFGADAFVTAVSGNNATATVTFWNGASSAITLTPTSSATGVSSTLKATCFHTGV